MPRRSHSHFRSSSSRRSSAPVVGFLLIAGFGILFAGCAGPENVPGDELVFTEDDVTRFRDLAESDDSLVTGSGSTSTGVTVSSVRPLATGTGVDSVTLDLSSVEQYKALRAGAAQGGQNVFQVTNDFLNIRETPSTGGKNVTRLSFGQSVEILSFVDGQWAKVKGPGGVEGYAAHRYLSKITTDERLADEKKQYENMYYVSYGFVNMRKEPNQQSEKLAEVPGQAILKPISTQNGWAKIQHDGKEGYVSLSYLAPFSPSFVVRQESYGLPVLHYRLLKGQEEQLLRVMGEHINTLRADGYTFMTFTQLRDVVLQQQQRDIRLDPKQAIIAISGITPESLRSVSDALSSKSVTASLFISTQQLGLSGITEKNILTLMANGFDIQSATHTGDDLRALTTTQVELELRQSRKLLEEYTRKPVFAVAYGQGGVNDRVAQIASDAGYLFGLGDDADRTFTRGQFLRIPALVVFPSMTTDEVVKFVVGE